MHYLDKEWIGIDIARSCNLQCEQCNHFSDLVTAETITFDKSKIWVENWSNVIYPKRFWFAGGEPLLSNDWYKYLELVQEVWKNCDDKLLYTNGLLLSKYSNLLEVCKKTKTSICISVHSIEIKQVLEEVNNILIKEKYIDKRYVQKSQSYYFYLKDIYVKVRDMTTQHWKRFYKGHRNSMEPYEDNNIRNSWLNCVCKAPTIYNDRIYKCSPLAFLKDTIDTVNPISNKWDKYLEYSGIHWTDSENKILEFFKKEEEWMCNMCSSKEIIIKNKVIYG